MKELLKLSLFFLIFLSLIPNPLAAATGSKVAAGYGFSLAVHEDGTVWSWGDNQYGQAGVPGAIEYHTPVQVAGPGGVGYLTDIIAVEVGYDFAVALRRDGTVWAWGGNNYGQLGIDSTQSYGYPVQVKNSSGNDFLSGVTAIACGDGHCLALLEDETVWAWGNNNKHQLNNTAGAISKLPVQCATPSGVIGIAAGSSHNLALTDDGRVWAWGLDQNGQLGDGTSGGDSGVANPVKSADGAGFLSAMVSINAGSTHSLAVGKDGSGWAWGGNGDGQLGNNAFTPSVPLPVQVNGVGGVGFLGDISSMTGGQSHSLALLNDGTLYSWGENYSVGLLGNGETGYSKVPVQVLEVDSNDPMAGVIVIASSQYHNLAVKRDGAIAAWGGNYSGQLGDGRAGNKITPYMVSGLENMIAVSGGQDHSLALKGDGTVWSWGNNFYGQLGDGTTEKSSLPERIAGLSSISAISAGDSFSLALKDDGTVWAWGRNNHGQLTIEPVDSAPHPAPVQVKANPTTFLTGIQAVAAGGTHALALLTNGDVKAWGNNTSGQLGIYWTFANQVYPTFVVRLPDPDPPPPSPVKLTDIYKIAAGGNHSLAINNSQDILWAWGSDDNGQLGDGLPELNQYTAVIAMSLSGENEYLSDVSGGIDHTLARVNLVEKPWVFGDNYWGQLGDGTKDDRADEYRLSTPAYTIKVAGGEQHSLSLTRDNGSVWAWGRNGSGQLGDGTKTERLTPNQIPGLSDFTEIAAGRFHSLALKSDGTVWTWGSNEHGQIGDGRVWNERVWVQGLSLVNESPWVIFLPAILKKEP